MLFPRQTEAVAAHALACYAYVRATGRLAPTYPAALRRRLAHAADVADPEKDRTAPNPPASRAPHRPAGS
jgi:hypothetical protein